MVRKVEVEPVLDNGNQWQEEEEGEVGEKRSGKRKVDLFEKGWGGGFWRGYWIEPTGSG